MSMASSLFGNQETNQSSQIEDLCTVNRNLQIQIMSLKKSLQQLIIINIELTQSLSQINSSNICNISGIDQKAIQQLASQIIILQEQLQKQKQQKNLFELEKIQKQKQSQELLQVVVEIVKQFEQQKQKLKKQLQKITQDLMQKKEQDDKSNKTIESNLVKMQQLYDILLQQNKNKQKIINSLKQQSHMTKKEMKISTTIQDLKYTLEKQMEDKEKVIIKYENILKNIKQKLLQKINT